MRVSRSLFAFTVIVLGVLSVAAQGGIERAIELYRDGDFDRALQILNANKKLEKKNPLLWNTIGLISLKQGKLKDARKAFAKAVDLSPEHYEFKLNLAGCYAAEYNFKKAKALYEEVIESNPKSSEAFYLRGIAFYRNGELLAAKEDAERAIELDDTSALGYILKSDALLRLFVLNLETNKDGLNYGMFLVPAVSTLKDCLRNCNDSFQDEIRSKLNKLERFAAYYSEERPDPTSVALQPGERKIEILSKPRPVYTSAAKSANETGRIELLVHFGADGKIGYIVVVKGLRYGLTEAAIEAAKRIRFKPAFRNGQEVDTVLRVHFNFSIF